MKVKERYIILAKIGVVLILTFGIILFIPPYFSEPHFKITKEVCVEEEYSDEGSICWEGCEYFYFSLEDRIDNLYKLSDCAKHCYETFKTVTCEQVEVDQIVILPDFCDEGDWVWWFMTKKDLSIEWLDNICEEIDENKYQCGDFQVETWEQFK